MSAVFKHVHAFLDQHPHLAASLEKSTSPNILYSRLPKHWRSNKSFQEQFIVLLLTPVPDNTEVSIWAGNDEMPCGEIRNEKARVQRQVAKFNDLRFVGRSGRGRKFHLTIVVHSTPLMVATVKNVIKVTVDGPREARQPKPSTSRRSTKEETPTTSIFPVDIVTPPFLPIWSWPMFPVSSTNPFVSTPAQPMLPLLNRKHRSTGSTSEDNVTESLNISSSPQTSFIVQSPQSEQINEMKTEKSPQTPYFPMISLTQITPDSVPKKRRRHESTTSSNGSSPTIWRPF